MMLLGFLLLIGGFFTIFNARYQRREMHEGPFAFNFQFIAGIILFVTGLAILIFSFL